MPIIAAIVKLLVDLKQISGYLSALASGDFVARYLRFAVVKTITDALPQNFAPITAAKWVLANSELLAREGPVNLLGKYLGINLDVLGAASSWAKDVLKEAGLEALAVGVDEEVLGLFEKVLQGAGIGNPSSPVRGQQVGSDPVNLGRGEFQRDVVDLVIAGAGIDFELRRSYGSSTSLFGVLGPNWTHSAHICLVEQNPFVLTKVTGSLAEHVFVRHPRFGQAGFDYFVPPNGVHEVIVPDGGGSFNVKGARGTIQDFEAASIVGHHRVKRIRDRFGNALEFAYTADDMLDRVYVNSWNRFLRFYYDSLRRLEAVEDHAGRVVQYEYDDWGYLCGMVGPSTSDTHRVRREQYEYGLVGEDRKLARVLDSAERLVVENGYEVSSSDWFGRINRQIVNRGESFFVYELPEDDGVASQLDHVALRVREYRRNGNEIEHLLNEHGNALLRREYCLESGQVREVVSRNRFNADGEIVASLDPAGTLRQALFGREMHPFADQAPSATHTLGDITMNERLAFGNRLASVTRGRLFNLTDSWLYQLPSARRRDHPKDEIRKYRFDAASQLLLSESDPRHTISPDPFDVESAPPGSPLYNPADAAFIDHNRLLTRFEYGPGPRYELTKRKTPGRTYPNVYAGVSGIAEVEEQFLAYDAKGRLLRRIDPRGYEWLNVYFTSADGAKEGFLATQLYPHVDWMLGKNRPTSLEVDLRGSWADRDRYSLSSGAAGDAAAVLIEGVRITLSQSLDPSELAGSENQVVVTVDGINYPYWNQTTNPSFVISGLASGIHNVLISGTSGGTIAVGRLQSHVALEFLRDELGNVIQERDPRGNTTSINVDALGRRTRIEQGTLPTKSVRSFEYDGDGNLKKEQQEWRDDSGALRPEGAVVRRFTHDSFGLLVKESTGTTQSAESRAIRNWYDVEDGLRLSRNARNVSTRFEYDALHRSIAVTRAACSEDASKVLTRYDSAGRVVARRGPLGAWHTMGYVDSFGARVLGFDAAGRPRVQMDPLGNLRVRDYDLSGNVTVERLFQKRPDNSSDMLARTEWEYDEHEDLVREVQWAFPSAIHTTSPVHAPDAEFFVEVAAGRAAECARERYLDAAGYVMGIKHPEGCIEHQRFDAQGRLYDSIDRFGRRTFVVFDGNGNAARTYVFESAKDRQSGAAVRQETFMRECSFDQLDREIGRRDSWGNLWQKTFDSLGNLTKTIDPLGNVVRYEVNAFGEKVRVIEERTDTGMAGGTPQAPFVTERVFDAGGNLLATTDAGNKLTVMSYDALDRVTQIQWAPPVGPKEGRAYDAAGNIRMVRTRSGLVKSLSYDLMDRNTRAQFDTTSVSAADVPIGGGPTFATFDYDAAGRLVRHQNDHAVMDISRDSLGSPIWERLQFSGFPGAPAPQQLRRAFDREGRCTLLVFPSGREVRFVRATSGAITSIENISPGASYPGRPANGTGFVVAQSGRIGRRPAWTILGNGMAIERDFDGRGLELERRLVDSVGAVSWRQQRLRDRAGHVRSETVTTLTGSRSRGYALDSIYRLTDFADSAASWLGTAPLAPPASPVGASTGQTILDAAIAARPASGTRPAYEYDASGNRTMTRAPAVAPVQSIPNVLDQYTAVGGLQWTWDSNGNLRDDGSVLFGYDSNGSLCGISDRATGARLARLYHDALGRTIVEESAADVRYRLFDGMELLVEWGSRGSTEYTPGESGPAIHVAHGGDDYWIVRDATRTCRVLLDGNGVVVAMPEYGPFGEGMRTAAAFTLPSFGGLNQICGLSFLDSLHRTYRPDIGRWLQPDPARRVDDLNPYTYVGNNPLERVDPLGLAAKLDVDLELKLDIDPTLQTLAAGAHASYIALETAGQIFPKAAPIALWAGPTGYNLAKASGRMLLEDVRPSLLTRALPDIVSADRPWQFLLKWGVPSGEFTLRAGAAGSPYAAFTESEPGFLEAWRFFVKNQVGLRLQGAIAAGVERPLLYLGRGLSFGARGASGAAWLLDVTRAAEMKQTVGVIGYSAAAVTEFSGFSIWASGLALKSAELAAIGGTVSTIGLGIGLVTGSTVLLTDTIRAAATGDVTPLEVADKFYGTKFSDLTDWDLVWKQGPEPTIYDTLYRLHIRPW